VKDLHTLMEKHNLSLEKAVEKRSDIDDSSPLIGETAFTDDGWKATADEFLESLSSNRLTTQILAERRVRRAVKSLTTKPRPRNYESLLRRYAKQHFYDKFGNVKTPAGGVERRRSLQEVKRFLEFAVRVCNAPKRYLPTKNPRLELELIGKSPVTTKQKRTVPLKPADFSAFLDWLEAHDKPELRLAVGLVGYFGLRNSELAVLQPNPERGELRVGMNVKSNAKTELRGTREPRLVLPLAVEGRPINEAQDMLAQYASGLLKLPKAIRNQIEWVDNKEKGHFQDVGEAFAKAVQRTEFWKNLKKREPDIRPYSFRHGWAYRAHQSATARLPIAQAAALMGHGIDVHLRDYGSWVADDEMKLSVERFNSGIASL
jgi:integrase